MPDAWIRQWGDSTLRLAPPEVADLDGILTLDRATPDERRRAIRALSTDHRDALAA